MISVRRERGNLQNRITAVKKKGINRKDRRISPENMSYLRVEGHGQQAEGARGRVSILLTTATLPPTTHGHFSGTCLQTQVQKELAGGMVNLFPM